MPRQYLAAQFPNSKRSYTYHNDGEPVAVGDKIVVEAPRGEGKITITVTELPTVAPPFATKAIIGKAPPEPESKIDPDEMLGAMMGGVSRNG